MSMFNTHENHIPEIEAAIKKHGEVYFHGDGNIYHKDSPIKSDDAVKYAQRRPGRPERPGPGSYRVKFSSVHDVPETLEELNRALVNGMALDMETGAKAKPNARDSFGLGKVEYKTPFPGQAELPKPVVADSPEVAALKAEIAALKAAKAQEPITPPSEDEKKN